MKISAVCTDIDGTLLDSRRELSSRTISTIKKINQKIPVVLASSRMPAAMRHLQRQLGILHQPLICYNGGYVIDFTAGDTAPKVFTSVGIPVVVVSSILLLAKGTDIHVSVYMNDHWYAPTIDQWTEREENITKANATIADISSLIEGWKQSAPENQAIHKVMCMGPEEEIEKLERELQLKCRNDLHIYRSRPTYLELASKKISKATALKLIAQEHFGISMSEVMAFGDNYNDIDMLQSVGLGIAVANAKEEVKAIAKDITLSSYEDGVAIAIEKYCSDIFVAVNL
jgi:Cof subfamily protein (haloacid dehalogenase superfamily)